MGGTKSIKILTVFGTRPEAIKLAPVIKQLEQTSGIRSRVVVTAQHRQMLDQVLALFSIKPNADLDIMLHDQTLFEITTRTLLGLERSEERRVGKECRSGWWTYHYKEKSELTR